MATTVGSDTATTELASPSPPTPVAPSTDTTASRPWDKEWDRNLPRLGFLSNRIEEHQATAQPTLNILRVNQVDAAQLDDELTLILRSSLMKIFSFWQVQTIPIKLLLSGLIYLFVSLVAIND